MWGELTTRTLKDLETARSEAALFHKLVDYARELGADLVSYHHVAPPLSRDRDNFTLMAHGFPEDWVRHYEDDNLHRIDPITSYTAYQTRPVVWSTIRDRIRLTDEQQRYVDELFAWLSPGDGMGVPTFGPSGRHGYIGLGKTTPLADWGMGTILMVQTLCEAFHMRFCELRLSGMEQDFELTDRELAILRAMAQGQSDPIISAITHLRPEGLRTAIVKLLKKMNVTDRPSAVLRARALGLLEGAEA